MTHMENAVIKALLVAATAVLLLSCSSPRERRAWNDSDRELAHSILQDRTLSVVDSMGRGLLQKGYNAVR